MIDDITGHRNPLFALCELYEEEWSLERSSNCFVKKIKINEKNFQLVTKDTGYEVKEIHWTVFRTCKEYPFHGTVIISYREKDIKLRGYFDLIQKLVTTTVKDLKTNIPINKLEEEDKHYFQKFLYEQFKGEASFIENSLFEKQSEIDETIEKKSQQFSPNSIDNKLSHQEIEENIKDLNETITYIVNNSIYFYSKHLDKPLFHFKNYLDYLNNKSIEKKVEVQENSKLDNKINSSEITTDISISKSERNEKNTELDENKTKLNKASKIKNPCEKEITKYDLRKKRIGLLPKSDFKNLCILYKQLNDFEQLKIFELLAQNCQNNDGLDNVKSLIPLLKKLYTKPTEKQKRLFLKAIYSALMNQSIDVLREISKISHFNFYFDDGSTPLSIAYTLDNPNLLNFLLNEMKVVNDLKVYHPKKQDEIKELANEELLETLQIYTSGKKFDKKFIIILLGNEINKEYSNLKTIVCTDKIGSTDIEYNPMLEKRNRSAPYKFY